MAKLFYLFLSFITLAALEAPAQMAEPVSISLAETYANPKQTLTVRELKKLIKDNQVNCPNLRCETSQVRVKNLTLKDREAMQPVVFTRLLSAAHYLSQSWGDGILEGNYQVEEEELNLDLMEKVIYDKEVVGFRITYSARAWDMQDCKGDGRASRKSCAEGRIIESGFVTLSLRSTFHDEMSLAAFKE